MINQPKRSPLNRNHTLHYESHYSPEEGAVFPVMKAHAPLITQYLDRAALVFKHAILDYGRVLVLRFDLSFPAGFIWPDAERSNAVFDRFINAFNSQLEFAQLRRNSPHRCRARHIAAREFCPKSGRLHFHVMLLLNGHAYYTLGTKDHEGSLFTRIIQAWASALRVPREVADPCVHVTNR
ncbi:MAG: inovirus Gp2 family protein, partial [Chromatiaceae bacterium]|nr:inovirus Gp2 family protein [Chromatiaceae bacterium]